MFQGPLPGFSFPPFLLQVMGFWVPWVSIEVAEGRGRRVWLAATLCPVLGFAKETNQLLWLPGRATSPSCMTKPTPVFNPLSVPSLSRYYKPTVTHLYDPHGAEKLSGALLRLWGQSQASQWAHTMKNVSTLFVLDHSRLNYFSQLLFKIYFWHTVMRHLPSIKHGWTEKRK